MNTVGALIFIAVVMGLSASMGALTMLVLGVFGVHVSFWIAWCVYIVLSAIFGGSTK